MAQRLATHRARAQSQADHSIALPCKLTAYKVQCPDVIPITRPRFGWTDKTFEVIESTFTMDDSRGKEPTLGIDLAVRETDAGIYNWATVDEKAESVASGILFPDNSTVAAPTGLTLAEWRRERADAQRWHALAAH
jgi:hypothetical protein